MSKLNAIILAAGKGTRMNSDKPKVVHEVGGKPMVHYVIEAVQELGVGKAYLVIGHQKDLIKDITSQYKDLDYVSQDEQLGTGHAVMQAEPFIPKDSDNDIIILAGDCPLIQVQTLHNLIKHHTEVRASATILSTKMPAPAQYGRILRDSDNNVIGIREAKDCSDEQLTINEINTGIYCFKESLLFEALNQTNTNNQQNEYYLTDVIEIMQSSGRVVSAYCSPNPDEAMGINTQEELAKCNELVLKN